MTGDGATDAFGPAGGAGSNAAHLRTVLDAPARVADPLDGRILDATLTLVTKWGMAKTTIADVAREAGCSRATVYRVFPGGKQELFLALGRRELTHYFDAVVAVVDAAPDTEAALTALIVEASTRLLGHETLQQVLEREPEIVLPFLGFHQIDRLYRAVAEAVGPSLERFVGHQAPWAAEWAGRTVLSYAFNPSPTVDLTNEDHARTVVRRFLLPALVPQSQPEPALAVHS